MPTGFGRPTTALREAVRLREEIAQGPNPSAEDRQSLADSRYQLGALMARRGAGRAEEAAYEAALEVQQKLVQQYRRSSGVSHQGRRGIVTISRCSRMPRGIPRMPRKHSAPRSSYLSSSIEGPARTAGRTMAVCPGFQQPRRSAPGPAARPRQASRSDAQARSS